MQICRQKNLEPVLFAPHRVGDPLAHDLDAYGLNPDGMDAYGLSASRLDAYGSDAYGLHLRPPTCSPNNAST